jgi:anti-sigma factor RsiW
MTMITYFIAERDLHGYVDNLLDQKRRHAVEAYLTRHAVLAETVTAYRAQNAALAALVNKAQPMPEPIRALMRDLAHHLTAQPPETDTTSTSRQAVASARR